jgi:hypothetical protein
MNTYENNNTQELNASDFLGNYLKKEDLDGDAAVTIIDVRADVMPNSDRRKLVVDFAEFQKPMVLNDQHQAAMEHLRLEKHGPLERSSHALCG